MKKWILIICCIAMFAGLALIENGAVSSMPDKPEADDASSVYALAGEFRVVFANLMWVKAEQYHHEFLVKNPDWTQNEEMLGMIKLIVELDPHFVEAYSVGAYVYLQGCKDKERAAAFLAEGLAHNPDSWELNRVMALVIGRHFDDPRRAMPYAQKALENCDDEFYYKVTKRLVSTLRKRISEQEQAKAH